MGVKIKHPFGGVECLTPAAKDISGAAGQWQWDTTQEGQNVGAVQMKISGAMMTGGASGASSREEWGDPGQGPLVHHDPGGARMSWRGQEDVMQLGWEPYSFSRSTSRTMEPNSLLSKKEYDGLTSQWQLNGCARVGMHSYWGQWSTIVVIRGQRNSALNGHGWEGQFSQPKVMLSAQLVHTSYVSTIAMNTNESVESSGEIIVLHYSCIEFLSGCPEVKMG